VPVTISLRGAGAPPAPRFAAYVAAWSALAGLSAFGAAASGGALPAAACNAQHYRIIGIPLIPAAINDSGRVAGRTAANHAAVWSEKEGLRELPMPSGYSRSDAVAINAGGHVLVMAYDQTLKQHQAFLYIGGRMTALPGEGVRAYALSDADAVAGEALAGGKPSSEPVVWLKNRQQRIANCCGGTAKGISASGLIVGDLYDTEGRYSAFAWTAGGEPRPIGPPGNFSSAIAVNAAGTAVIQAFPDIYLSRGGELEHLTLSPRFPSHPHAINACELVVGAFGPFSDAERAFIWDKTAGFQNLNALIPAGTNWRLESATGVNDRGEIVGRGDRKGDDDGGFLLLPAP
jgi:uncharacterized membrane protein